MSSTAAGLLAPEKTPASPFTSSNREPDLSPTPVPAPDLTKQRLLSLDVYRGIIMVTLAFTGFGLAGTARNHLNAERANYLKAHTNLEGYVPSPFWSTVYYQFEHVEWTGCGYWDLIQPSFMFMVGVAMAYSYLKRRRMGHTQGQMLRHALVRSVVLIFLGMVLAYWSDVLHSLCSTAYFLVQGDTGNAAAYWKEIPAQLGKWGLMNVLTQIGLGYTFLFLLWGKSFRTQALTAAGILLATWLLYLAYPGAGVDKVEGDLKTSVGYTRAWADKNLAGIAPAWHKNANIGHAIDRHLLNALPRSEPFVFNAGGYQTINFLPSLATMLFGLMCGELVRSDRSARRKLQILVLAGLAGLLVGQTLEYSGICPAVKRIWT